MKTLTILLSLLITFPVLANEYLQPLAPAIDPLKEYRQCGAPPRDADGVIKRSSAVIYAYRKLHPCPVTGKTTGACPGWAINHVIPLASGGCDAVSNMMWLPVQVKSCKLVWCVDRWERKYYDVPYGVLPTWSSDETGSE